MKRLLLFALLATLATSVSAAPLTVDRANREVRIAATVHPLAMNRPFGVKGHHVVVWKGGNASFWALFVADASDHDVRVALDSLGARRGENLSPDAWNERKNAANKEPDKRVEGSPIDVLVTWKGLPRPIPLTDLLTEKGSRVPRLDFRYGGNERYQKDFKSGCIVCLYSCPGGAVGNHEHPLRDYVRDGVVYTSIPQRLPKDGTDVTIILKMK